EALAKHEPADRRDQHDTEPAPQRIGDADRNSLQREGQYVKGDGIAEQAADRGDQPGELLRLLEQRRCRDLEGNGDGKCDIREGEGTHSAGFRVMAWSSSTMARTSSEGAAVPVM